MPTSRDIRGKYREIIRSLAIEHRVVSFDYEVPEDATLSQCIGYANQYVVGLAGSRPHYRYDRYMRVLESMFQQHPVRRGTIVHVDIGCGPGLFTWVVRDHLRDMPNVSVDFYGYDHAQQMVSLARSIWRLLEEGTDYLAYYNIRNLLSSIPRACGDRCTILVTLGHVLIQTVENDSAIGDFARIIAMCAGMANCLVVAVDARSRDRPQELRRACNKLDAALQRCGLTIHIAPMGWSHMVTNVRTTDRP